MVSVSTKVVFARKIDSPKVNDCILQNLGIFLRNVKSQRQQKFLVKTEPLFEVFLVPLKKFEKNLIILENVPKAVKACKGCGSKCPYSTLCYPPHKVYTLRG